MFSFVGAVSPSAGLHPAYLGKKKAIGGFAGPLLSLDLCYEGFASDSIGDALAAAPERSPEAADARAVGAVATLSLAASLDDFPRVNRGWRGRRSDGVTGCSATGSESLHIFNL